MRSILSLHRLTVSATLSLAVLASACSGGGEGGSNNPQNPAGEGPAPVELGSTTNLTDAGSYAILAKTGITNVTGSSISGGNLGVSPEVATAITGFGETLDISTVFSTAPAVVSPAKIYASDYGAPTPTNLTTAVLDMEAAYTDAAGRSNPDHLNLSSGNLGGLTLAPGLYNFGTSVTIPTNVTFAGGANDVWIIQISNDLDLASAMSVILSGSAQAKNIYWQVAGAVTLGAGSHFEGIILCQTGITLQTTASLNGRALSQSLVALDNNSITAP